MRFLSRVPNIDFMAQRRHALILSVVLSMIALVLLFTRGLNLGIDFRGGYLVELGYPGAAPIEQIREDLGKAVSARRPCSTSAPPPRS
jgi:Preprotein translocase subunit SecF